MTDSLQIPLFDLVNCLSEAVDLINPRLISHHKRVAYIAHQIATAMGSDKDRTHYLYFASSLHDIGAISYTLEEQKELSRFEIQNPHKHSILGYLLLEEFEFFGDIGRTIRYHHLPWADGKGDEFEGETVPRESHIIHLADRVDILIERGQNILDQTEEIRRTITEARGSRFVPEIVAVFLEVSDRESFWLDLVSPLLAPILQRLVDLPTVHTDLDDLEKIAKFFSHIIDFRSQFTATHSTGASVVAESLARLDGLPDTQARRIGIAGYLHDIGKLAVPNEVLDKEGRLNPAEFNIIKKHSYYTYQVLNNIKALTDINRWASSHHETLNGTGYPFRYRGDELDEGARILTVADIFTALTEDRPYRPGMGEYEVKAILQELALKQVVDGDYVSLLEHNYDEVNRHRIEAQRKAAAEYTRFWSRAREMLGPQPG